MGFKKNKAIVIGVTGGFGTGKTTVAKAFGRLGAKVLDADRIAHRALRKNTASYRKVIDAFGRRILDSYGRIDRNKLAGSVFKNRKCLKRLCDIVHPVVIEEIKDSLSKASKDRKTTAVVIDAPLLIEENLHKITDFLIVAKTSMATQMRRAMKKTGLPATEVMTRIASQMPLEKKEKEADYIIDNEGAKGNTENQVKRIWARIKANKSK